MPVIENVHHLLERSAALFPTSPALTYRNTTVSYEDLWRQVQAVARGLEQLDVGRDDRVAIFLEKRIEAVVACLAASACGGIFVPINPHLRAKQVAYILADCDVKVLVTSRERFHALEEELAGCPAMARVVLTEGDGGTANESDMPRN